MSNLVRFEYITHGTAELNICLIPYYSELELSSVLKAITEILENMSFSKISLTSGSGFNGEF